MEKKKKEKTKNRKIVGFSLLWVVWVCAWVVSLLQVCFFIAGEQCSPLRILSKPFVGIVGDGPLDVPQQTGCRGRQPLRILLVPFRCVVGASIARPRGVVGAAPYNSFDTYRMPPCRGDHRSPAILHSQLSILNFAFLRGLPHQPAGWFAMTSLFDLLAMTRKIIMHSAFCVLHSVFLRTVEDAGPYNSPCDHSSGSDSITSHNSVSLSIMTSAFSDTLRELFTISPYPRNNRPVR